MVFNSLKAQPVHDAQQFPVSFLGVNLIDVDQARVHSEVVLSLKEFGLCGR